MSLSFLVGNQVPRYSGWKLGSPREPPCRFPRVGNQVPRYSGWKLTVTAAIKPPFSHVGNQVPRYSGWKPNNSNDCVVQNFPVGNQVPRYSGWKLGVLLPLMVCGRDVGNQVPRYSGWKLRDGQRRHLLCHGLETKYRDIADGNLHDDILGCVADEVCWEPRGFLARMQTRNPITTYPRPTCVSQT